MKSSGRLSLHGATQASRGPNPEVAESPIQISWILRVNTYGKAFARNPLQYGFSSWEELFHAKVALWGGGISVDVGSRAWPPLGKAPRSGRQSGLRRCGISLRCCW